jgi:transcriptional regulator with XRE-family HTH domain
MTGGYMMLATMPARRPSTQPPHPLRLWREAKNLSQQEVADSCQLTQAMISFVESGKKTPWGESLERLRDFTGLPADAFLRWQRFLQDVGGEAKFMRKYAREKGRSDQKK